MGCCVPVQEDYLFICCLFNNNVNGLVKDYESVNKTSIYKVYSFSDILCLTYKQSHQCKSWGTHNGHRTGETELA
jgi:hypothetical protein